MVCEVKPTDALGDRTAFDAIIWYRAAGGDRRFVAIETKYTEPFSAKAYDSAKYRSVTEGSGWFQTGAAELLRASATNQLWRGLMLAALIFQPGQFRSHQAQHFCIGNCSGKIRQLIRTAVP